ncbi:hypothetical protein [Microbulbifer sp. 2304DJ12-6]|uniref:hypothetical protein n=1 Tax=Microbulbifer sp. 2304DJ12-6 TaxID=3233340 RepID=UPI0039B0C370
MGKKMRLNPAALSCNPQVEDPKIKKALCWGFLFFFFMAVFLPNHSSWGAQ